MMALRRGAKVDIAISSPTHDPHLGSRARDFRASIGISLPVVRRWSAPWFASGCPERIHSLCCRCSIAGAASFATGRPRYRSGALKSSAFGEPEPNADSSVAARVAVFVEGSGSHLLRNNDNFTIVRCFTSHAEMVHAHITRDE